MSGIGIGSEPRTACDLCLRRAWLLAELSAHLEPVRSEVTALLALDDEELVAAVGGRRRERLERRLVDFAAAPARREVERAGLELICRCDSAYPAALNALPSAPAVLHVAGGMEPFLAAIESGPVAIVGSRRASSYGTGVAHSLSRGLASAGVPVISGMAFGIDASAHEGALAASTQDAPPTVAVLPGPADQPYPRSARALHRRIVERGSVVSEIPPGVDVRSWMFLARNRIIAGLAAMTVVVEAGSGSAALLTARHAEDLGRAVGAVPGRVTAPHAAGPNRLLSQGASLITGAQDVLDVLFGAGSRLAPVNERPELSDELRALLAAIEAGHDTAAALGRHGVLPDQSLAALASLELAGYVRRGGGGRFTVMP